MRTKRLIGILTSALALSACGGYGSDDNSDPIAQASEADGDEGAAPDEAAVAQGVQVIQTALGDALANTDGFTLYGFTNDTAGVPTCEGQCAETWPPFLVDGPELPAGLDPNVFRVVPRPDGSFQLAAGAWPLYLFSGDTAAGETNGQGSGGVWYVVTPTGGLIRPEAAPPADDSPAAYGS
ncbi:MAG: COG4315 family predicted lipoprotein [Acidimicrobiales bacterium]